MYVCLCNGVTECDIRHAAAAGCSGMTELTMRTGCGSTCGSCVPQACALLAQEQAGSAPHASESGAGLHAIAHAA